jgi:hypothetical protein
METQQEEEYNSGNNGSDTEHNIEDIKDERTTDAEVEHGDTDTDDIERDDINGDDIDKDEGDDSDCSDASEESISAYRCREWRRQG